MGAPTYLWSESKDAEMQSSNSLLYVVARAIAMNTAMWTSTTDNHDARKDTSEDIDALLSFFEHLEDRYYAVPWLYRDGAFLDRYF